jgi:hypothetical protein
VSDAESATGTLAPLSVESDLSVAINGGQAEVESTGRRLLVRFRSLPDAMRAARGKPSDAGSLQALLVATDLTVEVRARDHTVAVAGADARPGAVSRLLGVAPVEVRISGALGALGAEAAALF